MTPAALARAARHASLHALPVAQADLRGEDFVGTSPCVLRLLERADRLAVTEVSLLLTGETGTGKEVLARRIHAQSRRAGGPFVALNCAALSEALVESELFGHARGSFTGADRARKGLIEEAQGGSLLLDEVGELPLAVQAKLLRVLQDGRVRPVGSSEERRVDLRILAATNRELEALCEKGSFRSDLYYRLCGAKLELPPLREREGAVRELALHFLARLDRDHGTQKRFAPGLLERWSAREWPGNVRQLQSEVARLFHLAELELEEERAPLRRVGEHERPRAERLLTRLATLEELEREALELALQESQGNRDEAARRLGISRSSLYERVRRFGLEAVGRAGLRRPALPLA